MDAAVIILFAVVLVIGGIALALISIRPRGKRYLDAEAYRTKWLNIEQSFRPENEESHHMAILNADKLLDTALKERGFNGNTMGERMKSAQKVWSNANHVWTAHKLRNRVAHESDLRLNTDIARRALVAFKQALKDLGAI